MGAAGCGCTGVLQGQRGFTTARRSDQECAGASLDPATEKRIQRRDATVHSRLLKFCAVIGCHQPGEYGESTGPNGKVMEPAGEVATPELEHLQLPPRMAVYGRHDIQGDDTMRNTVQLQVRPFRSAVVQHDYGAVAPHEELLEGQDLAPVAKRALRQKPHLG